MRSLRLKGLLTVVLAVAVAAAATVGGAGWLVHRLQVHGLLPLERPAVAAPAQPGAGAGSQGAVPPFLGPETIADMVERVGPAVVRIETTAVVSRGFSPFADDPFFRYFFGDLFEQQEEAHSLGTGVIVSPDGYIITNQHVVDGAREVQVRLYGEKEPYAARIVGQSRANDLAVLKIEPRHPLTVATLGDSDRVRPGEWVVAIGNPFGYEHTVSVGVISAKGRAVTVEGRRFESLLQTDAAINPGNSGGPLLNLQGEVIGINVAVNRAGQGIGFAIPSNLVKRVYEDLKAGRGDAAGQGAFLGIEMAPVNQQVARYLGLDEARGALVVNVLRGSPAAQAGLQRYDVVLEVDRKPVQGPEDLRAAIQAKKPGDQVLLLVWRDGRTLTLVATLTQPPANR